jgi:hypothetical protein
MKTKISMFNHTNLLLFIIINKEILESLNWVKISYIRDFLPTKPDYNFGICQIWKFPQTPDSGVVLFIVRKSRIKTTCRWRKFIIYRWFYLIYLITLPEYDADTSKHVAVLVIYKILLIYIYCAFVGMDNKLYRSTVRIKTHPIILYSSYLF